MLIGFHIGESRGPSVSQIGESQEILMSPLSSVMLIYMEIFNGNFFAHENLIV